MDKLTADDVLDSLTGHDEIQIEQHTGKSVNEIAQRPTLFLRALIAVVESRLPDKTYRAAYADAMNMRMDAVADYFAEPVEEADESDPDSDQGKDD